MIVQHFKDENSMFKKILISNLFGKHKMPSSTKVTNLNVMEGVSRV